MLFDDLLPQLLGEVPGCPDITAINALRNAAIEFCRETEAWAELQEDPIPLADNEHTYDVECPSDAVVVRVLEAWVDGSPLTGKSMSEIGVLMPGWQSDVSNRPIYFNAKEAPNRLRLFPTPANTQGELLTLRVAYAPKVNGKRISDQVGNRHLEALMSGAKARLMAMPKRAWTDLALADYHKTQFANAITDRRIDDLHGGVPSSLTVKPVRFG
ncbi:hypothetical protein [Piscinibacter gummiphilus]|uniref:Uncharacterized protein n=1 Tax=Piscinibacter gummiphilus TaxID=946333 RepID=A0ABZ0CNC0_9BURK|nr:hypothetical protein [Piscinibacter gummiphilus]WOB06468.1 hypothetical protein RXV79_16220 [Piscinibacter gummiphilus]